MNRSNNTFSTDSFQLAIYLLATSCQLEKIDSSNPKRFKFIFEENDTCRKSRNDFITYAALIEPHRLFSAQADLRQLLYQYKSII